MYLIWAGQRPFWGGRWLAGISASIIGAYQ
jgi:hypothetical protein